MSELIAWRVKWERNGALCLFKASSQADAYLEASRLLDHCDDVTNVRIFRVRIRKRSVKAERDRYKRALDLIASGLRLYEAQNIAHHVLSGGEP